MEAKLTVLKVNFEANFEQIFNLERNIGKIRDADLRNKLRDLKIFECLSAEKATPHFLNIAKKSKASDSIANIKNDASVDFHNEDARARHIVEFYSNLYKDDPTVSGDIETFLGPELCATPQIRASKLSQEEATTLDQPLSIEELDKSLKQVNMKSAPGIDGYSYRFISKFWGIFRVPLYECAVESLESGTLPTFFSTAQIKIIPKKGDTSKIKNWRPISLLSNFYKIISRLINNRLKKICNRTISRAQKGFNQSRQLHEAIINALENINFCKKNKINGAMLSVDMAKAFDSVAHSYLEKVYNFFGFGERIRKWLKAIGTERCAVILLENGKVSDSFDLKRGTAQGDSPSPFLYNLAAQILIWKIELDPNIKGVHPGGINGLQRDPDQVLNSDYFAYESNYETSKNESFADDANNFLLLDFDAMLALKTVLADFKKLSGLECNIEKSFVMRIGDTSAPIDQRVVELGFPFTEEITVLGFVLRNDENYVLKNFEKISGNISNIIRFWERFNLSLPGKIAIYKTLLVPQINFIASILTPPERVLREIEECMEKFVLKGIKIAKKRAYEEVKNGGLGMFDLKKFITALQCSWIKRACVTNDNWKLTLKNLGNGNVLDCHLGGTENLGTALKNILSSYRILRTYFPKYQNNFLKDKLFNNPNYGGGRHQQVKFDEIFFGFARFNAHSNAIANLRWENLLINGEFTSEQEFEHMAGFSVSRAQYTQLKNCFKRHFKPDCIEAPTDIDTFFRRIKKGSKWYRKVMEYVPDAKNKFRGMQQVKSYCKTTGTEFVSEKISSDNLKGWNIFCFPNRFKVFLFKYYNNILGTANRVAHFSGVLIL